MTMIERVARAIMRDDFEGDELWESSDKCLRGSYLRNARAAIEAMRDPTDGMVDAGNSLGHEEAPATYYEAMIDAALAEVAE